MGSKDPKHQSAPPLGPGLPGEEVSLRQVLPATSRGRMVHYFVNNSLSHNQGRGGAGGGRQEAPAGE